MGSLARFLGVLPYKRMKSVKGNMSFESVLTPGYISMRLLIAATIFILHIKFWIYDYINSETSFQEVVFIGCSTTVLGLAVAMVFVSTIIYGKSLIKLTTIFPKMLSSKSLTSDKRFLSESFVFLFQAVYLAVVVTVILVVGLLRERTWKVIPNLCISMYSELVTHSWTFIYFNRLLRLRMAFEELYSASLVDDLNVVALKECWSRYLYLRGVVVKINRIQGLNAIFCITYIYVWQLHNLYTLLVELSKDKPDTRVTILMMIWVFIGSAKLFVLIYQAPKCANLVRKFRMRLANYSSEEYHIEEVRKFFEKQLNTFVK